MDKHPYVAVASGCDTLCACHGRQLAGQCPYCASPLRQVMSPKHLDLAQLILSNRLA